MKRRYGMILGISLFICGFVGLAGSFIYSYIGEKRNKEIMNNFEMDKLMNEPSVDTGTNIVLETEEESNSKEETLFEKDVIAIVSIPKVNIKYPVKKGTDPETLKKSLGYFEGTGLPGQVGNFCVAGHRNSSYARYFNRLDEVNKGDEVVVETRDEKFVYIVTKTMKIHENQTDILNTSSKKMITLITCTNGLKPKYRIVVQGELKSQ